jgi:predicted O-methyltransferase YrrM
VDDVAEMIVVGPGYGPPAPVPVYQWEAEFEPLLDIYRAAKPLNVLEVGSFSGGTLYHWLQNAPTGARVTSLDLVSPNRHLYDDWVPPGVVLTVLNGDSRSPETVEFVRELAPFDWVFIDAGHRYPEVRDDWENYRPMGASGAVIAFHDILPPSRTWPEIEVAWLWKEIQQFGWTTQEIIADPRAEWGGLGLVWLP